MASRARRIPALNTRDHSLIQLKTILADAQGESVSDILAALEVDHRQGAGHLAQTARREIARQEKSRARVRELSMYEDDLRRKGFALIAGCDEVGRGALAGPIVAAAVILDHRKALDGIDDSKKLTARARTMLYDKIINNAVSWAVFEISSEQIDEGGIQAANIRALVGAVEKLDPAADFVLSDAFRIDPGVPTRPIIKGDSRSVSIAAASIIAKVYRDRLMTAFDAEFTGYGFASHKGYGAAAHIEAIRKLGACPIHRRSFSPVSEEAGAQLHLEMS